MHTVGAFEAKTNLSKLLDRASKGESIIVEKHGMPVAVIGPPPSAKKRPVSEVIAEMRRFRDEHPLNGISIRELIEEGRKW